MDELIDLAICLIIFVLVLPLILFGLGLYEAVKGYHELSDEDLNGRSV